MKVKSFGCSFIFGSELADDGRRRWHTSPSMLTWPALIAKELAAEYRCYAIPGVGNLQILQQIMHQSGLYEPDVFYIIGWTWLERFDFIDSDYTSLWQIKWQTITPTTESNQAEFYYKYFHTELKDKLQSLIYIRMAIDLLQAKNIPFVMTCIDDLLFDRKFHAPVSIIDTQDYIKPYISDFQGKNFLDWSKNSGFQIGPMNHPLKEAHAAAADLMITNCQKLLDSRPFGIKP
jgi:hypothetical protein